MKVVYLNIKENKEPQAIEIKDDLKVFYNLLNCSTIDIVRRKIGNNYYNIICDDCGLFVNKPKISAISPDNETMLVGNIIIGGQTDDEGNIIDLTDYETTEILAKTNYRYVLNVDT